MTIRIRLVAMSVVALVVVSWSPPAMAAAPSPPTLVGPADGSTASTADVPLSVRAGDPDGGSLDVRFEGRRVGATAPGGGSERPFTLVALPDTQNYTYGGRQGTIVQQTQWAVNSRAALNTAMVVQLGDLVSNFDNLTQWGHASTGFQILDDANLPNTVVAGNHDFVPATGEFAQYDRYFPPSRYAGKPWTPSTARYGGYLGQNLFGPDPVDRRNMDNFALFSAGGRDFLVLNLEWEAPAYALEWAAKVLAAYPDRIAIMVTHSFVGIDGQRRTTAERPGGTPADRLWTDFVAQQCSIKLVLSGHFHAGNLGEANRSDRNRCGQPVQQILTDYQDRPNGGDGWLRYYRFDPAANTMTATTYSPKLDQFETDADSAFTVPFDLGAAQPAPFTTIGTARVAAGEVARTTWTGLVPDTGYEWRAVADDGTTTTTSPTWTVRTPASSDLVDDTFSRNVSNGWGAADAAHAWQLGSSLASYRVDGSVGRVTVPVGAGRSGTLTGVSGADVRVTADLSLAQAASGSGTYVSLLARAIGTNSYRAKLRYGAGGALTLSVGRVVSGTETTLATANVAGVTATPGLPLRLRLETAGTAPTSVRAKVWPVAGAEPASWTVTGTDATAVLQAAGTAGVDSYVSSTATAAATVAFDRFTVSRLGAALPPPPPPPPPAALARDGFGRTVNNGWGTADAGGPWTVSGTAGRYAVAGGTGRQTITAPGTTADAALTSVTATTTDLRLRLAWNRTAAAGTLYASVLPRRISSTGDYRCKVVVATGGAMQLSLVRRASGAETTIRSTTVAGLTQAANQSYSLACRAVPSGTGTQLSGKLWRTGSAEPAGWSVSATDTTAGLQAAGGIGISSYLSSGATTGVTLSVDDLVATRP